MSLRKEILYAFAERLRTITVANGYPLDLGTVFGVDKKTPLSLNLEPHEMPAIIVIDEVDDPQDEKGMVDSAWAVRLQLIDSGEKMDGEMLDLCEIVGRCLISNSFTAEVIDGWRSMHPRIYRLQRGRIDSDLNMIEANRIYSMQWTIHYRAKQFEF